MSSIEGVYYAGVIHNPMLWMNEMANAEHFNPYNPLNSTRSSGGISFEGQDHEYVRLKLGDLACRIVIKDKFDSVVFDKSYSTAEEMRNNANLFDPIRTRSALTGCFVPLFPDNSLHNIVGNLLFPTTVNQAFNLSHGVVKTIAIIASLLADISTLPIRILTTPIELIQRYIVEYNSKAGFAIKTADLDQVKVFISMTKKLNHPVTKQTISVKVQVGKIVNMRASYTNTSSTGEYRSVHMGEQSQSPSGQPASTSLEHKALKFIGLSDDATIEDIKKAYKKLALKFHPDRHPEEGEKFRQLNAYHKYLLDPNNKDNNIHSDYQ